MRNQYKSSTNAPGEACGASLGDQLLDLGSGRSSSDLSNRDVCFSASGEAETQHLIGNVENRKESGKEWVT